MNLVPLGLTVFLVLFVIGTVFWMSTTLGPIRKKQAMRKQAREQQRGEQSAEESPEESSEENTERNSD
ncbi:hypothetical protein [Congregibacter sp.]|uniref:hypothetical protein n=1 Tax=Congregibacter sp. TaxID=2744308 RepID=UPI003F6CDDBC